MKKISIGKEPKREPTTPPMSTLFTGHVTYQPVVTDKESKNYNISYINFDKGIHTKLHEHSSDQVLIVTKGKGIFGTEKKKVKIQEGDVIFSPAGEKHWHGAAPGSKLTHVSITAAHSHLKQFEK